MPRVECLDYQHACCGPSCQPRAQPLPGKVEKKRAAKCRKRPCPVQDIQMYPKDAKQIAVEVGRKWSVHKPHVAVKRLPFGKYRRHIHLMPGIDGKISPCRPGRIQPECPKEHQTKKREKCRSIPKNGRNGKIAKTRKIALNRARVRPRGRYGRTLQFFGRSWQFLGLVSS